MDAPHSESLSMNAPSRGEQARQALIDAALILFARQGPQGATTRDIARAAGQNLAAITYYFQSKQGLYLAVVQWIADTLNASFQPLRRECEQFLAGSNHPPERYRDLILRAMAHLCHLMTRPQTLSLSLIISREQLFPSAASPILQGQFITPLHTLMTCLVAGYTGMQATHPATSLHTHALIGQVLAFRMARETILNRTGWHQIGPTETQAINAVLQLHTELLLNGLRQRSTAGNVRNPE